MAEEGTIEAMDMKWKDAKEVKKNKKSMDRRFEIKFWSSLIYFSKKSYL